MTDKFYISSILKKVSDKIRSVCADIEINKEYYMAAGDSAGVIHTFKFNKKSHSYELINSFPAHNGLVYSLCFLPPSKSYPKGSLLSGGKDCIKGWGFDIFTKSSECKEVATLIGHNGVVCCINCKNDIIYSSGWDGRAILWVENQPFCQVELGKEKQSILSIVPIEGDYFATLGNDFTLRLYDVSGHLIFTQDQCHSQAPMDMKYNKKKKLLYTCGNDGMLKEWLFKDNKFQLNQSILLTDKLCYSLCATKDFSYIFVGSDDHVVYVIHNDEDKNMLVLHDAIALTNEPRNLSLTPFGDFVFCSYNDGAIFSFTTSKERKGDKKLEEEYLKLLREKEIYIAELVELKIEEVPLLDDVEFPAGTGSFSLGRKGYDKHILLNSYTYGVIQVGKVDDKRGASVKKYTAPDGKEYDVCITVDIEDGRTAPLYFNINDNPYDVAAKFQNRHNLSIDNYQFIAKHVEQYQNKLRGQNTQGVIGARDEVYPDQTHGDASFSHEEVQVPCFSVIWYDTPLPEDRVKQIFDRLKEGCGDTVDTSLLSSKYSLKWGQAFKEYVLTVDNVSGTNLLGLLYVNILDDNTLSYLDEDEMGAIISYVMVNFVETNNGLVFLLRTLINSFKHYASIYTDFNYVNIAEFFMKYKEKIKDMKPQMQLLFAQLALNFSIRGFLYRFESGAVQFYKTLLAILSSSSISAKARAPFTKALANSVIFNYDCKMCMRDELGRLEPYDCPISHGIIRYLFSLYNL